MRDLSLHLLDIAENSINAGASLIEISLAEDTVKGELTMSVLDNGRGFQSPSAKEHDPYFTSKGGKRFGLGIPLLKHAAEMTGGQFSLSPRSGGGTALTARFMNRHIDMKPTGDIGSTIMSLVGCHPEIDYAVSVSGQGGEFTLDTRELKKELEGLPLNTPSVLGYIKEEINEAIRRTHVKN